VLAAAAAAACARPAPRPPAPTPAPLATEALLGGDDRDAYARAEAERARGKALYETQRFEEAIAAFAAGYEAAPWPVFLFNIGQARRALSDCRAVFSFRRFLQEIERLAPDDPARTAAAAGVPVAQRNLAALERSCATAMKLPTTARGRRWYERRAVAATMAGGVVLAGLGGGALYFGERTARRAATARSLDEADDTMADASAWRLGGASLVTAGVALGLGAYVAHRLRPSFVDEVTVEVAGRAAIASIGGRF
jgi:tetratricopeptide (TPR) repeat protein